MLRNRSKLGAVLAVWLCTLVLMLGPLASLGAAAPERPAGPAASDAGWLAMAAHGQVDLDEPAARLRLAALAPQMTAHDRQAVTDAYYRQIIKGARDLEAFARIADLEAGLCGSNTEAFMADISRLALDATGNWQAVVAGPWGRIKQRLHALWSLLPAYPALGRFGSQGFAADDGGNQVQHFWYSVAVTYKLGPRPALLAARYHEWNAPGVLRYLPGTGRGCGSSMDLALSGQAIGLGQALAGGSIKPREVGDWLRANLGTG